jgi:hypothetical protein
MTIVRICYSIKSSSRSPCASQSRTAWSIWYVGFLMVAGLLINPLIMSSSSWFLSLRDSSCTREAHKSFSGYRGGGNFGYTKVGIGLAGGYKVRFFVIPPLVIAILLARHSMYTSSVASHGLPSINRCPSSPLLGLMMRKSDGYSQELIEMAISCNVPTGQTTDRSANCSNIAVGLKELKPRYCRFP